MTGNNSSNRGSALLGTTVLFLLVFNTLFWFPFILVLSLFKLLIPIKFVRKFINFTLDNIAQLWVYYNSAGIKKIIGIEVDTDIPSGLSREKWYLIISNHQSWIDIVILQSIFTGKIPMPKFFLKSQLKWVPVLGLAWWALDYPFMKRYSKKLLEKKPHLKGKDMENTIRACNKFRDMPVSIINFVEGTRYSEKKSILQNSPFRHLLKPKSGGIGYVFTIMGEYLTGVLNVTIVYPENSSKKLWDFMCGRIKYFKVYIEEIPFTDNLKGNYLEDDNYKSEIQNWINEIWQRNDSHFKK